MCAMCMHGRYIVCLLCVNAMGSEHDTYMHRYACHMYFIVYIQKVCWVLCSYHVCVTCLDSVHAVCELYAFVMWGMYFVSDLCGIYMPGVDRSCLLYGVHAVCMLRMCM